MPQYAPLPPSLQDLVLRTVLGDRSETLDPQQAEELAAEFVHGGAASILARLGTSGEAAASLVYARELSRLARHRLANQATALSQSYLAEPDWNAALQVIDTHRSALAEREEVVGIGPGFRRRNGIRGDERCVVVYVDRKRTPSALRRARKQPIPATLTSGGIAVATDVVALGRLRRQAAAGSSVGPKGRRKQGTIGIFATDLVRGGTVALTAMHVFGTNGPGEDVACVSPAHGLPRSAALGSFRRGTLARTDAAVIGLAPSLVPVNTLPEIGTIRGMRPISLSGDIDRPVRLRGAKTDRVVSGTIVEPLVHLPGDDIEAAILADIPSVPGDSGAALVDTSGHVLGFLVGVIGPPSAPRRVFTPAILAMQILACDFLSTGS